MAISLLASACTKHALLVGHADHQMGGQVRPRTRPKRSGLKLEQPAELIAFTHQPHSATDARKYIDWRCKTPKTTMSTSRHDYPQRLPRCTNNRLTICWVAAGRGISGRGRVDCLPCAPAQVAQLRQRAVQRGVHGLRHEHAPLHQDGQRGAHRCPPGAPPATAHRACASVSCHGGNCIARATWHTAYAIAGSDGALERGEGGASGGLGRQRVTNGGHAAAAVADELFGTPEKGATCSMCLRSEPSPPPLPHGAAPPHTAPSCSTASPHSASKIVKGQHSPAQPFATEQAA